ncbi:type II CRISPR RNA-guided endonuclease Cas9 [Metamycoplasma neophronis]|uniref:CRISPR-associated endonuclease Cas9 n=1 Tax=Metamycoplasma neophronis TaxID=872983 RepID=A0ABY2Z3H1_9BACT|nr:type II CRISPR RNA-guided endonuclease Cas9 [Metamycoplasma neophronis]TPR53352.1 type II CRISPR RNA-guided endonuclease Cas9 [Metamycoplasma neophronis]
MEDSKKLKEVSLGLDLGIGSVGWSLIDNETNDVIALGSRLFNEPNLAQDRREKRGIRRSIRRKAFKKNKFAELVLEYKDVLGIPLQNKTDLLDVYLKASQINPYIINTKVKALSEKITPQELVWILHDYLKNRGVFYEITDDKDKKEDDDSTSINFANDKQFPSLIEKEFFDKYGKIKNIEANTGNHFSNKMWVAELKELFNIQSAFYNEKIKEFFDKFLSLFTYIRSFEEGPGNIKSPSPYGIYQKDESGKVVKKYNFIWEKTTGKCSIFKNEFRAPANTPSAEFFDILQDLNNTTFFENAEERSGEVKMDSEAKEALLKNLINKLLTKDKASSLSVNDIKKEMNKKYPFISKDSFKNQSTEYKKPTITFNLLHSLILSGADLNKFSYENLVNWLKDLDTIYADIVYDKQIDKRIEKLSKDNIIKIFAKYLEKKEQIEKAIKLIAENNAIKGSKTHSLSLGVFYLAIPDLCKEITNLEKIKFDKKSDLYKAIIEYNKANNITEANQDKKYMSSTFIQDAIISPSVKTSIAESIKVFNQIIKQFGKEYLITKIGLEMPRDKNSDEERKNITKQNKKNESVNKDIIARVNELTGMNWEASDFNTHTKLKLLLWFQQEHLDWYTGKEIELKKLINNPGYTEIDHILPQSQSFDDSIRNKVLVLKETNRIKGNRVPKDFLSAEEFDNMKKRTYNLWISKANDKDKKNKMDGLPWFKSYDELMTKYKYLLHETITPSDELGFAQRNLNDTRYACKIFLEQLKDYSKAHNKQFLVEPIRGKFTSLIRKMARLTPKDRDIYSHHAIDASILAIAANNINSFKNHWAILESSYIDKGSVFDKEDGSFICKVEDLTFNSVKIANIVAASLGTENSDKEKEILNKVSFTRKVIKRNNVELFNETLYALKESEENPDKIQKVQKISVYDLKEKYFNKKNECDLNDILMYRSHPQEFAKLQKIFAEFGDFTKYMKALPEIYPDLIDEKMIDRALKNKQFIILDKNKISYINTLKICKKDLITKENVWINPNDRKSFKESFNWVALLIYKTNEDKYAYIPVNAKIYRFTSKKVDFKDESIYITNKLNEAKLSKDIPLENKPIDVWFKGNIFNNTEENQDYYLVGAAFENQTIEFKNLSKKVFTNKNSNEEKRTRTKINIIFKKYKKCNNPII